MFTFVLCPTRYVFAVLWTRLTGTARFRVHTGAKPYSCRVCGKTFRTVGNKNIHEASHRDDDRLEEQGEKLVLT